MRSDDIDMPRISMASEPHSLQVLQILIAPIDLEPLRRKAEALGGKMIIGPFSCPPHRLIFVPFD